MELDDRFKLAAFEGATTYANDFRVPPLEPFRKYRWSGNREEENVENPPAPQSYTCHETLSKLRDTDPIPANLFWSRGPIIDPPMDTCVELKRDLHASRAEIIRTRPRVYFGSAVSIDDVPDTNVRNMLLNYMYTTDFKRAMEVARTHSDHKSRGVSDTPPKPSACTNGVEIVSYAKPPLELNVIDVEDSWDRQQIRATVDPTATFWRKRNDEACRFATETSREGNRVSDEISDRLMTLIDENRLRAAHDKPMVGFTGHTPACPMVNMEKIDFPLSHPMKTTNELIYVNHYDHAKGNLEK